MPLKPWLPLRHAKHSPLDKRLPINDSSGTVVAWVDADDVPAGMAVEMAQHIVRACNAHDALVEAMTEIQEMATPTGERGETGTVWADEILKVTRKALKKARGTP
jgi:hypothetical protein